MKKKRSMTKAEAWFLLVAGLVMGTVFTFGMRYWNAPVTREEAVHITAVYGSYTTQQEQGRVKEIILRFEGLQQLYIDGACIDDELLENIAALAPGTGLSMTVHPNSNKVLELQAEDLMLLEFEDTSEKLTGEATGFMGLGLFCYALSVWGLACLLFGKKK